MCPRIGHINFLNVLPLTYSYAHGYNDGLDVKYGVPAELNGDISQGRLDASNVSSVLFARHADSLLILPGLCVRSVGRVESIILVSRLPVTELAGSLVTLTAKSATSHCLLKIILAERGIPVRYDVRHLTAQEPLPPEAAAALLIGDDALYVNHHRQEGLFYYDLGAEWQKLTGKNMVYALWVVRRSFAKEEPEMLKLVCERISQGLKNGYAHKEAAIKSILAHKPFTYEELDEYLEVIRWDLQPHHVEDLQNFYHLAYKHHLIPQEPAIEFALPQNPTAAVQKPGLPPSA